MMLRKHFDKRFRIFCLALVVALPGAATEMALARSTSHGAANATIVSVIAGKPSELAFKLTNFSALPVGTITFKVKNQGVAFHDFKLCVTPVTNAAHTTCVGKATAILKPGQTTTLTMKIRKKGLYEYLCSVPGHAAAGMKGLIGIGVAVKARVPTTTAKTTTTTTKTTTKTRTASTSSTTTTAATTTASATTTTTSSGGGSDGCPAGLTIQQEVLASGASDRDQDENGGPTDFDGCI